MPCLMYTTSALAGSGLLCPQAGPPRSRRGHLEGREASHFLEIGSPLRAPSSPVTVRYAASKKPELSPFPLLPLLLSVRPSLSPLSGSRSTCGESRSLTPFSSSYPACCKAKSELRRRKGSFIAIAMSPGTYGKLLKPFLGQINTIFPKHMNSQDGSTGYIR